ncbi:MAG: hypothetical protein ACHQ4J_00890 [Candidatus Binatia bacterium]
MTHGCRRAALGFLACAVIAASDSRAGAQEKGSLTYLDAKNGFRGVPFSTSRPEVVRRLHLEPFTDGTEVLYRSTDEKLALGSVRLTDIRYRFLKNKFFAVTLIAHDASSSPSLLDVIEAAFGPGSCTRRQLCTWDGKKVHAEYKETATELPTFTMWSELMSKETSTRTQAAEEAERKARAAAAAEAADDL